MKNENTTAIAEVNRNIIVPEVPYELEFFQAATGAVYLTGDRNGQDVSEMVAEGFADKTPQFVILSCARAWDVWSYGKQVNVNETLALYKLTDKMARNVYLEMGKVCPPNLDVWVMSSWVFPLKSAKDNVFEAFISRESRNAQICGDAFYLPIAASVTFKKTPFKDKKTGQTVPAHTAVWKREELPEWVAEWVKTLAPDTWLSRYAPGTDLEPRKISTPTLHEIQVKALQSANTQHVTNGEAATLDKF